MSDMLQVSYHRTGGIAGITMAADAAESDLEGDTASIAARLLDDASSSAIKSREEDPLTRGADLFTYTLGVSRGDRSQTFIWSDLTMPDEVQPLVRAMAKRSRPVPD